MTELTTVNDKDLTPYTPAYASENGARFFNMEKLGALTVGRPATFLVARGTVQQLPRKLSYLEGIYVDGAPSSTYLKKIWSRRHDRSVSSG